MDRAHAGIRKRTHQARGAQPLQTLPHAAFARERFLEGAAQLEQLRRGKRAKVKRGKDMEVTGREQAGAKRIS